MGYGYPLAKLAGRDVEKEGTRSPHSIFYFTLAYSGIVGFAIFAWLEISVIHGPVASLQNKRSDIRLDFFYLHIDRSIFRQFN